MFVFESVEQIKDIILNNPNKQFIKRGRQIKREHELHICGIGKENFINKIVGYENDKARQLRIDLSYYFTVPIMANSLRPVDKIFNTKGTFKRYEFSDEKAEIAFKEVLRKQNIEDFLFQRWKNLSFYDPNGLIYIEINSDKLQAYPTYKSIDSIYDISFENQTEINYIIFEPEKTEKQDVIVYRVVDSKYDYTIVRQNNEFTIDTENTFIQYFEKVPAFFINNKIDRKTNVNFDTYISEAINICDSYFRDASIHEVYKVKQGIPYVWELEMGCPVCQGSGVDRFGEKCSNCDGKGTSNHRRDVADKIIFNPAMSDKELRPVAGFIQPDLETWNVQNNELDLLQLKINSSIWGSDSGDMVKTKSANTTAFEVSVTEQSKSDKLNLITCALEIAEKEITDYLARYNFPTLFKQSVIKYSRRYNLKTPEELFNQYITAKEKKVNSSVLNSFYVEYLMVAYDRNELELKRQLMILRVKPLFHNTPDELLLMQVDKKTYLGNLYFDDFVTDYETYVKPLYLASYDEVEKALDEYVNKELSEYESIEINKTDSNNSDKNNE